MKNKDYIRKSAMRMAFKDMSPYIEKERQKYTQRGHEEWVVGTNKLNNRETTILNKKLGINKLNYGNK